MKRSKVVLTAMLTGMLFLAGPVKPVQAAEARYAACLNCGGSVVEEEVVVYEMIDSEVYECSVVEGCTYRRMERKTYIAKICIKECGELSRHLKSNDGIRQMHSKHH